MIDHKEFAEGEYEFGSDTYVVTHLDSRIGIRKGEAFYELSWMDVEDGIFVYLMREGKPVTDLKNPLNYLFYKIDRNTLEDDYYANRISQDYFDSLEKEMSDKWRLLIFGE